VCTFFGPVHVNSEKHLLASSRLSGIRLSFYVFSVRPQLSARIPLEQCLWNLILGTCMKICRKKTQNFVKIGQKYQTNDMTKWERLNSWHHYEIFCLSTRVQWETLLVFSWQNSAVSYFWQLHTCHKRYKG